MSDSVQREWRFYIDDILALLPQLIALRGKLA
jgi:hypothetical protein